MYFFHTPCILHSICHSLLLLHIISCKTFDVGSMLGNTSFFFLRHNTISLYIQHYGASLLEEKTIVTRTIVTSHIVLLDCFTIMRHDIFPTDRNLTKYCYRKTYPVIVTILTLKCHVSFTRGRLGGDEQDLS